MKDFLDVTEVRITSKVLDQYLPTDSCVRYRIPSMRIDYVSESYSLRTLSSYNVSNSFLLG